MEAPGELLPCGRYQGHTEPGGFTVRGDTILPAILGHGRTNMPLYTCERKREKVKRPPVSICLGVLMVLGTMTCAHAYNSLDVSSWGSWDPTPGAYQFNLTRPNVQWASSWAGENNLNTYSKPNFWPGAANPYYHGTYHSGGEWYDVEGLYMDVAKRGSSTYLEWLMVSSYTGLEPGEWTPSSNWNGSAGNAGTISSGSGYYANMRNGNNSLPWVFRSNPVIAIDLNDAQGSSYNYGLVLDTSEQCNVPNQTAGTPYDITTSAGLYHVPSAADWIYPDPGDFPLDGPSDLNTTALGAPLVTSGVGLPNTSGNGFSVKRFVDQVQEPNGWTDPVDLAYWPQAYNWYWEGAINITGTSFLSQLQSSTASSAHYTMWCANDYVNLSDPGQYQMTDLTGSTTPELSSGVLLIVGGLLVLGLGLRRKTQRAAA